MSFDLIGMRRLVADHGKVARVVVAGTAGSVPREVGAAMCVWPEGQEGTIGGGALEFEAAARARQALKDGDRFDKVPLGPGLGQCCGGAVRLLTEIWDAARLDGVEDWVVRPVARRSDGPAALQGTEGYLDQAERQGGASSERPLPVARRVAAMRNGSRPLRAELVQGWMIEPVEVAARDLWVWGAGHVGRAIVGVMAPLPGWQVTWVDTDVARFPEAVPDGVRVRVLAEPSTGVGAAAPHADHLILTYSHALDLELCHRVLTHGAGSIGLIGSETKWARFRGRLAALGHSDLHRITCPIGDPTLGKHPQAIALGVAMDLMRPGVASSVEVRA